MLRILTIVLSAAVLVLAVGELADRRATEPLTGLTDPLAEARLLLADGRSREARWLAEFSRDHPDGDRQAAERLLIEIDRAGSGRSAAASFLHGAISGEPDDLAGLLGALSLDLFVIGDLRDLAVQGSRELRDGSGDDLILALSAIGLGATVVPHLDWAPALLKSLRRAGALTPRFVRSARHTATVALRNGDFSALSKLVSDVGVVTTRLGPRALKRVIAGLDDGAELARVAAASRRAPGATYALAVVAGKPGIRAIEATGSNVERLARAIRLGSRGGKIGIKSVRIMPDRWLLLGALAAAAVLAICVGGGVRRARLGRIPVLTEAVR